MFEIEPILLEVDRDVFLLMHLNIQLHLQIYQLENNRILSVCQGQNTETALEQNLLFQIILKIDSVWCPNK